MTSYKPGLHIIAEFSSAKNNLLSDHTFCKPFFDELINRFELSKVGEVYHNFENGGFTAVICLTESHLSIHTWPEFNLATFDVFLSNFKQVNNHKVKAIYAETLDFFGGSEMNKHEIAR
ncbi:S-adenosylmethionine decarboxylase family protein [Solitalea canadensis]|uniref:S-adenosylmethionine decarboxylase n=1 Tax=Solitalea canadensis (strain ATCC 29591 / DSM 3403 / JCM 21819 / LMG 8368 / NBRC 15130 / NCIMB 12057 / USAM 9D) TaxID=929556 RepID=H8KUL7_SOLCM|nr:S-adenosylmethionine decarboxylase [Solitalea canadensis]AFD07441.1 S-adenosylmethionine decarboxylase [Solitalea canadensis DSM 3403]